MSDTTLDTTFYLPTQTLLGKRTLFNIKNKFYQYNIQIHFRKIKKYKQKNRK